MEKLRSKEIARNIKLVRKLDEILDILSDEIDGRQINIREEDSPVKELCAFVDAMERKGENACVQRFGMLSDALRLQISEILCDMAPEGEECLQTTSLTLKDVGDAWTQILWERTMRAMNVDGSTCRHF